MSDGADRREAIARRLVEERRRLGLNQSAMARTLNVTHHTLLRWERGLTEIKAGFLARAHERTGLDPLYVLVGQRMAAPDDTPA